MNRLKDYQKDYDPYYNLYLKNLDSSDSIQERLQTNQDLVYKFFNQIKVEKYEYSYGYKKWNISQIFQHIIDTERIFCYRALKIVREKDARIVPYDHEAYADNCKQQSKGSLLNDYRNNRNASISLFETFDHSELMKSVDFDNFRFRVGLIPFIFCGHELHHLKVIKDFYLT